MVWQQLFGYKITYFMKLTLILKTFFGLPLLIIFIGVHGFIFLSILVKLF